MQPNFGNVYRIPESRPQPEPEKQPVANEASVYDVLDAIYQSQGINELGRLASERWVSPVCDRIERIGKSIEDARSLELDSRFFAYDYDNSETGFITSIFRKLFNAGPVRQLMPITREKLINEESRIGGEIFGEQPGGEHLSFFYYGKDEADRDRWYCKKEKEIVKGDSAYVVLCFEIQDNAILKVITKSDGSRISYEYLHGTELENFIHATEIYHNQVMKKLYGHEGSLDGFGQIRRSKLAA